MAQANRQASFAKSRQEIARKVRDLRNARGWTQAELAKRLHLSQNRLSEIERGQGSFTAEQFLLILRLFNVTTSDFTSEARDVELDVQNALARHGATQLQESANVLPSEELDTVHNSLREALLLGSPRLVTGAASVLANHAQRLSLPRLYVELAELGHGRRLAWLVDNTLSALNKLVHHGGSGATTWTQLRRRAELPFRMFLDFAGTQIAPDQPNTTYDVLDATIRTRRTLEEVQRQLSGPSIRWGIVTNLQPQDFVEALKASRAGD